MSGNYLLAAKALHIIFMVSWFAGLFYIPRLFIYQKEATNLPAHEQPALIRQLKIMAQRLWYIITWPAMIITLLSGISMLVIYPPYLSTGWMQLKLGLVLLLVMYHLSLHWLFRKQQRDIYPMKSTQLRFYNEVATVLLFAIVFTVVFKNMVSWLYGVGGILLLGVALSVGILLYKKARGKK